MDNKFTANGFSTVLPDGWADRSVITLVAGEQRQGFAANVVILREDVAASASIEDYARDQIAAVSRETADFELLDERPATIDGKPAYQTLQRFSSNGVPLQQAHTYVLRGRTVYAFICTALAQEFDRSIPAFRAVMDNLAFDD